MDVAQLGMSVRSDGVVTATNRLRDMERQSGRADSAVMRMARNMKAAFAGMAIGAAAMFGGQAFFGTLSKFETSMAAVGAITRASTEDLSAMREVAKELGATTEYTAAQAADGLKFFGMAGWNAAQSIAAIPAVLDLATAAQMDLASAADISSNIMSGFGIAAEDAARVADILATVASRANTDVRMMGDGMKYVAPIAAGLKISIEESAAAMGVMSDAGMQGSMAGTGLRMIMASLISPTKQAAEALAQYGLTTADVSPATHSLAEIMEVMVAHGIDATNIFDIMEARAATAWVTLSGGIPKLKSLTGELQQSGGAAKRMADTMRDQLGGDAKGLQSALEGLIIQLGESGLTSILRALIQGLTAFARELTSAIKTVTAFTTGIAQATGIASGLGAVFGGAAEIMSAGLERLLAIGIVVATFFAVRYVAAVGVSMVQATMAAVRESIRLEFALGATSRTAAFTSIAIKGVSLALGLLRAAIISTGIGVLVIAAGELIYRFMQLSDAVGGFGNAMIYLKELGLEVWDRMKTGAGALWEYLQAFAGGYVLMWQRALSAILTMFAKFTDDMLDATQRAAMATGNLAMAAAIEASRGSINAAVKEAADTAKANVAAQEAIVAQHKETADQMAKQALGPLYMWKALTEVLDAAKRKASGEFGMPGTGAPPTTPTTDPESAGGTNPEAIKAAEDFIKKLQQERQEIGLTGIALKRLEIERAASAVAGTELEKKIRQAGADYIKALIDQQNTDRDLAFKREIDRLKREGEALNAFGDDRAVLQRQMQIEEQRRQDLINSGLGLTEAEIEQRARLTQAEKDALDPAIRANLELERRIALLDGIQAPLLQYKNTLAAVQQLMASGSITGTQGQDILNQTDLMRGMKDIEQSLPGYGGGLGADAQAQIDSLQEALTRKQAMVDTLEQAGRYKEQQAADRRIALAQATEDQITSIKRAAMATQLAAASQGFGQLADVMRDSAGEQSAIYKIMFAASKAFAIANSIINIQEAMSKALTLPPPANFAYMGIVAAEGASIISAITSVSEGFADGGYTGAGGKYDVAGVVHKGEVVWSQQDVARYGGWQNVDAMRRGAMPAANDNGGPGGGRIEIEIGVSVDDDGRIRAYVANAQNEAVNAAVSISDNRTKARMDASKLESQRPVLSARG